MKRPKLRLVGKDDMTDVFSDMGKLREAYRAPTRRARSLKTFARIPHGERRSAPGAARIARLRRQIGAEPFPFSLLPPRPPRAGARHDSIVSRIEAEEARLVASFEQLGDDLERRLRSWAARGKKGFLRPKRVGKRAE
jgi:hypothetical protein